MLLLENSILKKEYLMLVVFLTFAIFLTVLIIGASYFTARQNPESEKLSAYECGFEPYEDTRHTFDIRFCVTAILFIVRALNKLFTGFNICIFVYRLHRWACFLEFVPKSILRVVFSIIFLMRKAVVRFFSKIQIYLKRNKFSLQFLAFIFLISIQSNCIKLHKLNKCNFCNSSAGDINGIRRKCTSYKHVLFFTGEA